MSVIILEVEKAGLTIRQTAVASEALARYVTAMHNSHESLWCIPMPPLLPCVPCNGEASQDV